MLLKWQNYTLKQKKRLTKPSVNLVKSQVADSCEKTVSNLKKRDREWVFLLAVGCFLAIRMSETLGLCSDLYLLTEAQEFHFLSDDRCGVLKNVVMFCILLLEEKTFCLLHCMDCILALPQTSEKSSVNSCPPSALKF